MENTSAIDPRYPIGKAVPAEFSTSMLEERLNHIRMLPGLAEQSILNLDEHQIDTPYRDGGWTVRQVVHHLADSHINAYTRFKLGLTEENPTIRPYNEKAWAELADSRNLPVNLSITLLHALHARLYELLRNITDEQWERTVYHPEQKKEITLWQLLGTYAWHGRHHVAHITTLRDNMKWK